MKINLLDNRHLNVLLSRERLRKGPDREPALDLMLKEILRKANQFVPSEAGSILLDDPIKKREWPISPELVFVACFGPGSSRLPGLRLPVTTSIAGATYLSGKPYLSKNVNRDKMFYSKIDQISRFQTRSIICAPIFVEHSTYGVIELINRKEQTNFTEEELKLLEIFAGYTSTLIQNVLDARKHIELAKRDGLTGLFNDRYFHTKLEREVRQVKKGSHDLILLFMDMDHFKQVNDQFGHLTGSHILQEVSEILQRVVPSRGTTIARYGGDEFVIIFSQTTLEEVVQVADRIRTAIKKFPFSTVPIHEKAKAEFIQGLLTCSIGLASLRRHIKSLSSNSNIRHLLIRKADAAMYTAKEKGKDRICIALP
ncbi:MAG: sensor domain-containing diguanylate cyclase [Nitrospirae bacterium]|nr:sensor domain-containing diguanylate cyclase [Candidatus Manganitrophaceae bacterium]